MPFRKQSIYCQQCWREEDEIDDQSTDDRDGEHLCEIKLWVEICLGEREDGNPERPFDDDPANQPHE